MTFEVAAELLGVCTDVKTTVKISVTKCFFRFYPPQTSRQRICQGEADNFISFNFSFFDFFFLHKSFLTAAIWWRFCRSHCSHKCCLASQCEDTSLWIILTRNYIYIHAHTCTHAQTHTCACVCFVQCA